MEGAWPRNPKAGTPNPAPSPILPARRERCYGHRAVLLADSFPTRPTTPPKGLAADLALLAIGSAVLLIALILWFDNAQGSLTGNGAVKSIEVKPWIADPAHATLYPSNYLFYPAYGALCRLLDLLGVFAGDPRRQFTILNATSASLCTCVAYALARTLTGDRVVALIAALFHIACSFVLLLAITNEDIMPSYTLMFASMALAAVWFAQPTAARVVAVACLFSLGWLFEWRLIFPTLPAMLVALWLCEPRPALRAGWIALFLAAVAAMAVLAALAWQGHDGAVGPVDLLWTGKAVHSVWAGFTWAKIDHLRDGMAAYLLGTAITPLPGGWDLWRALSLLWTLAVAAIGLSMLWGARREPRARALAAVFGGTFLAGQIFNLYAQPQDPQMQINVMAWLTPGWALVLAAARRHRPPGAFAGLAALTVALLAYNVWSIAPLRGLDTAWQRTIEHVGREADPARTVFLIHDFDWTEIYAALQWGMTDPGTRALGPAPQETPRFKWIGLASEALRHPEWGVDRQVAELRRQIDRAMSLGYDVVVARLWDMDETRLETTTVRIVDSGQLAALRTMLHRDYAAGFLFDDPLAGRFYRLQPAR